VTGRSPRAFALGVVVGAIAGAAGTYLVLRRAAPQAGPPDAGAPPQPPGKKRPAPARPPRPAGAADMRIISVGDVRADQTVDMRGGGESRDLAQGEIDAVLAGRAQAVQACLLGARETVGAGGKVTAAMLVGPDGGVKKTRVEAPKALVDAGLASCLRDEMMRMHFPATGGNSVVTVPLAVE
jgi:hypothetical protein